MDGFSPPTVHDDSPETPQQSVYEPGLSASAERHADAGRRVATTTLLVLRTRSVQYFVMNGRHVLDGGWIMDDVETSGQMHHQSIMYPCSSS